MLRVFGVVAGATCLASALVECKSLVAVTLHLGQVEKPGATAIAEALVKCDALSLAVLSPQLLRNAAFVAASSQRPSLQIQSPLIANAAQRAA